MAATPSAPGPKRPELYPVQVGPKYQYYGEQPGWIYDPYNDQYVPDPDAQREYYEERGLVEKQPGKPGLGEQIIPLAGPAVAVELGKQGGKYIIQQLTQEGAKQLATQGAQQVGVQAANQAAAQGAAQAGTQAGGQLAGQTAGQGAGQGIGAYAGTAAWVALALYGAYKGYSNYKKLREQGIDFGEMTQDEYHSVFHPDMFGEQRLEKYDSKLPEVPGTGMGPIEFLSKGISPMGKFGIGTHLLGLQPTKHEHQIYRDRMRDHLEKLGFAQKNEKGSHVLTLSDGSTFDIGIDGIEAGQMGVAYNIDLTNPQARKINGWAMPLAAMLFGGDPSNNPQIAQMAGYLTNAAMSSQNPEAELMGFFEQLGFTDPNEMRQAIADMGTSTEEREALLDAESVAVLQDAINQQFDPNYDFGEKPWWSEEPEIPEYAKLKGEAVSQQQGNPPGSVEPMDDAPAPPPGQVELTPEQIEAEEPEPQGRPGLMAPQQPPPAPEAPMPGEGDPGLGAGPPKPTGDSQQQGLVPEGMEGQGVPNQGRKSRPGLMAAPSAARPGEPSALPQGTREALMQDPGQTPQLEGWNNINSPGFQQATQQYQESMGNRLPQSMGGNNQMFQNGLQGQGINAPPPQSGAVVGTGQVQPLGQQPNPYGIIGQYMEDQKRRGLM